MREVRIAGRPMQRSAHVCVFFNSDDEKYRTLLPYIKDGIDGGDKSIHLFDPAAIEAHICCMKKAGIDTDGAAAKGQLQVLPWEQSYLQEGRFDAERMIRTIEGVMDQSRDEGYALTRFIGGMEWALIDKPGVAQIVEYESKVNRLFARKLAPLLRDDDVRLRPAPPQGERGDGHPAHASFRHRRRDPAGEPVLRAAGGIGRGAPAARGRAGPCLMR